MKKAFDNLAKLRTYVDPNYSGRDWNLATAMVIKGDALVQVMGDWAKGEFNAAKKDAGHGLPLLPLPGHRRRVIYNTDMFAMFNVPADRKAAQVAMADRHHEQELPVGLQRRQGLGPGPHRRAGHRLRPCGKKGIADVKAANARRQACSARWRRTMARLRRSPTPIRTSSRSSSRRDQDLRRGRDRTGQGDRRRQVRLRHMKTPSPRERGRSSWAQRFGAA